MSRPTRSPSRHTDPLQQGLQQSRCLHCRSYCYRVERTSSRAGIPHLGPAPFTAHEKVRLGLLLKKPTKIPQSATTVLETIASKWFLDIFHYGKSGNSIEKDRARSSTRILGCLSLKLLRSVLEYRITKAFAAVCNHEFWHLWSLEPCLQRAPSPQSSGHRGRSNNLRETGWPTRQPLW